jgi:hypothetical protein
MGVNRKVTAVQWVLIIEVVLALTLSVGVGLIVGAFSASAGIGAGLLAFSAIGFLFVIAWERGNAVESAERRR